MKFLNHIKTVSGAMVLSLGTLVTSCDFLDIVPPEQATLADATKDADATLGFLCSCYAGIGNPVKYTASESSVDEYVCPQLWGNAGQRLSYDLSNQNAPADERWTNTYKYIGQTLLFLQELPNARGITETQREEWTAEAYFLLAFYHAEILRFNGPCPITETLLSEDTTPDQYGGRWHYDAAVDWIVDTIDEKVLTCKSLRSIRNINETGRVTSVIAKALKARVLLYAASPLWNGSFPYPEWRNKVDTEYRGKNYGKELVSATYSPEKWERARVACEDALNTALNEDYMLYGSTDAQMKMYESEKVPLTNVYIPGGASNEFKERVLMLRYLLTARVYEGNTELIWGLNDSGDSFLTASMPNRVLQQNNGNWVNGYSGISPLLNTVERFYMADGKRLDTKRTDLFERSGIDAARPDIIKMNVNREARFYAWLVFDQGDYSTMYVDGSPLRVELKVKSKQGWDQAAFNRNHCVTGYLAQKFMRPSHTRTLTGSQNLKQYPRPLMRMAELYLNLAECYAAQNNTTKALEYLNPVHQRAGLPAITQDDITTSGYSLMEWVRNERFCEFWGEGQRFHDIHRWAKGPEYLSAGKHEGLNAEEMENPSFEIFNKRVKVNQPFSWSNRMYLATLGFEESSKNLNLVQAPGY